MLDRMIIFLIRRKLGVKKFQRFKFKNQKQEGEYYFNSFRLVKILKIKKKVKQEESGVSLNWLLNNDCEIEFTNC